jgi:hypothetical protein
MLRGLVAVDNVANSPDWPQSAGRPVDILVTGSQTNQINSRFDSPNCRQLVPGGLTEGLSVTLGCNSNDASVAAATLARWPTFLQGELLPALGFDREGFQTGSPQSAKIHYNHSLPPLHLTSGSFAGSGLK